MCTKDKLKNKDNFEPHEIYFIAFYFHDLLPFLRKVPRIVPFYLEPKFRCVSLKLF